MTTEFDLIDDYFGGEMPEEGKKLFDQKVKDDPEFAKEVAFYLSANAAYRMEANDEKKRRFKNLYKDVVEAPSGRVLKLNWIKPVMSAAAVLLLALMVWTFFLKPPTSQQLADRFINQQWNEFGVNMGPESSLDEIKNLYNQGHYSETLTALENKLRLQPENAELIKLAGIVSLRLKDYDKALGYFKWLSEQEGLHDNPGEFYQALTLMKRNLPDDRQKAKILLQDVVEKNLSGIEEAQNWIKHW